MADLEIPEVNKDKERAERLGEVLKRALDGIEQKESASEEVREIVQGVRELVVIESMFPGLSRDCIDMITFTEAHPDSRGSMLQYLKDKMEKGAEDSNQEEYDAAKEFLTEYLQDEDPGNMESAIETLLALGIELFPKMPKAAITNREFLESVLTKIEDEDDLTEESLKKTLQTTAVSMEEPEVLIATLDFESHNDVDLMMSHVDMILGVGEEHKDAWVSMLRMRKVRSDNDVVVKILNRLVETDEFEAKTLWEIFNENKEGGERFLNYCANSNLKPDALAFVFSQAPAGTISKELLEKLVEYKEWRTLRNMRTETSGSWRRHLVAEALDRNVDQIPVNIDNQAMIKIGREEQSDQPSVFLTIGMIGRSKEARLRVIERMHELRMEQEKKAAQILAKIAGANPHGKRKGADDEYFDEDVIAAAKAKLSDVVVKMSEDGEF